MFYQVFSSLLGFIRYLLQFYNSCPMIFSFNFTHENCIVWLLELIQVFNKWFHERNKFAKLRGNINIRDVWQTFRRRSGRYIEDTKLNNVHLKEYSKFKPELLRVFLKFIMIVPDDFMAIEIIIHFR